MSNFDGWQIWKISYLLASGIGIGYVPMAQAQPSKARIMQDLKSPGVLSVKLLGNGRRVWSSASSQYVWDQSAVVVRKAKIPEYPNAKIEIGGIASYSIVGGRFPFKKFYVSYNSYSGIPAPSAKTIVDLVKTNLPEFLGHKYTTIVGDLGPIALAQNPKWNWYTPNSVSMLVTTSFTEKISSTQTEKKKQTFEVRLYRDAIKKPWTKFGSSSRDAVSLGTSTHESDALDAMKTLAVVDAERMAKNRLNSLPDVTIPKFKTDLEAFAWLHKQMREGNPQTLEAALRQMMAPNFYQRNSTVLLDSIGEDKVQNTVKMVFGAKAKYAEQYGPDPAVEYQTNMISFVNADGQHRSSIRVEPSGGEYQDGVKVNQEFKISDINIWVAQDADTIARLNSMSPAKRFAPKPNARLFSQLGQQVVAQEKSNQAANEIKAIQWTPFTSNNAKLQANFPGTPTETQGTMNGQYPMWTVEVTHPQVLARAISIFYPRILNRLQAQTTVQSALKSLAESNNLTIKSSTEVGDGTYGQLATMEGDGKVLKVRVWAQNSRLYQLILSGAPSTMATLNERNFFGTFQPIP